MSANGWKSGLLAAITVAATACGGSNAGRMSVSAKAVVPATAAAGAASGSLDLGQGIAVTRVRIAIARLKLEGSGSAATSSTGGGMDGAASHDAVAEDRSTGGEDGEVEIGPFAVDLSGDALAGGVHPVFDSDVPTGTYAELTIEIAPAASLAALSGSSIVIDGTVDGEAFTFSSRLDAVQKRELPITVAAGGSSSSVTLSVDPAGWFAGAGGRLDPRSDADHAAIEANVAASIDAFDDENHDGRDDRTGGSGGDGPGHG